MNQSREDHVALGTLSCDDHVISDDSHVTEEAGGGSIGEGGGKECEDGVFGEGGGEGMTYSEPPCHPCGEWTARKRGTGEVATEREN
jgi:hypothetical protein